MSETALEVILGIVFLILGFALLIRLKKLSKSKYYRLVIAAAGVLLVGFGIYLAYSGIYLHA